MDSGAGQPSQQSGTRRANIDIKIKFEPFNGTRHTALGRTIGVMSRFLPFKTALLYQRSLKLTSERAWRVWCMSGARPANIHSAQDQTYKHDGWQGWAHWLGTSKSAHERVLHVQESADACTLAQAKGTDRVVVWYTSVERPAHIPSAPNQTYRNDEWQGRGHCLGTGKVKHGTRTSCRPKGRCCTHAPSG